ncbi:3'-5' exonuclease [Altererythrobacter sp. TH136]|uniref:3'-5' exonuclease n=1 Tax=Altererythrobacter sp. TH136 TaxID=2067415 RepID=UPI001161F7D0|nr:3'-5' exonuclease [Altererythrobacter sp. TH136]QDM40678.1 DNA polymerase III subunit epsilon [Altererythrobacter sp. TH136]
MTYYSTARTASEILAEQLEADPNYRVLRRLPHREQIWCRSMPVENAGASIVLGVIDSETTGLDCQRDKMIELALVKLTMDPLTGDVLDVSAPISWLEDPGEPLSAQIEALTGLTDADLAGEFFCEEKIFNAFSDVDVLVAHNAAFDCGFLAARFPRLNKPVACSLTEIEWPTHGLEGGKSIGSLLTAAGHFLGQAHRAAPDAWALCCLLMMRGADARSIASHLFDRARRPTARAYAVGAPYALKDTLKAAGYRWAAPQRAWAIEGETDRIASEVDWLTTLLPAIRPKVVAINWRNRHTGW